MTDRLEPCPTPWCEPEHEKYIWQGPDDLVCVICDGCQVEGPSCENEGGAHDAWNTRSSLAAQDDPPCTDCHGTGYNDNTERPCTCDAAPSLAAHDRLVEPARLRRLADDCSGHEPSLSALQRAAHDAAAIIEQMFEALKTARVYLTDFEGLPDTDCDNPLKKIDAALASIEVKP